MPDAFDQFWTIYPRKVAKGAARRAFASACRRASPSVIIAALQAYPFDLSRPKFIPHPATWLNGDRWEDELTAIAPQEASPFDAVYREIDRRTQRPAQEDLF